jgi:hypothetical protein
MIDEPTTSISDSMISVMMKSVEIFAHANRQLHIHEGDYNFNVPIAQFDLLDVSKSSEIIDISRKHLEKEKKNYLKLLKSGKADKHLKYGGKYDIQKT